MSIILKTISTFPCQIKSVVLRAYEFKMVLENEREPRILTKLTRSDGHQAYLFKVWRFFAFSIALSLSLFLIFSSLIFSPRRFYDILPFSAEWVFCSVTTVHRWPLLYRFQVKSSFIEFTCGYNLFRVLLYSRN